MFVRKYRDKYRFGERYKDPLTDKWRTITIVADRNTRNTRHEAQIVLDKKIRDKLAELTGERNTRQDMTLGELYQRYLEGKKLSCRENSVRTYEYSFDIFFSHFDKDTKIGHVTSTMLINHFDYLVKEVLHKRKNKDYKSAVTFRTISGIKIYYTRVSSLFTYAVRKKFLKKSPFKEVYISWPKNSDPNSIENKYLDENELKILLSWFADHYPTYGDLFEWQYLTGMRFGEASGIQIKNVNQKKHTALINGTLITSGKKTTWHKQMAPKTNSSYRTVELSDRAMEIFNKHKKGKRPSDFLFTDKKGDVLFGPRADNCLKRFKKDHHFGKTITTHTFRHTHVSKLAELGVPLYLIQHNVGHSNSKITQQVYLHVTEKAEQQLADKLNLM